MPLFTSRREKHIWFWTFTVLVAIFSTLFVGQPFANVLADQNVQAIFFVLGMLLVGAAMVMHGLRNQPGKFEIAILLGIVAVYTMFFLRLGITERSHLIEYSVLAIFIHQALLERVSQGVQIHLPALIAWVATVLIGIIDECIQIFLPNRVFDPIDILFNGMAATMAIGCNLVLTWVRKRFG
jgi:hypothetical protein